MKTEIAEFPLNLLFSKDDIPRIEQNIQYPVFHDFWQALLKEDIEKDGNFLREAFIYAITGKLSRGKAAKKEILKILEKKHWDSFVEDGNQRLGFLQGGRLTAWMSLGYDWIYDLLTPEERTLILQQIAEKGCIPILRGLRGMRYPETVKGWGFDPEHTPALEVRDMRRWQHILGHNNFRAVMSGGLALGIFAVERTDPRAEEWKEMLLDSFYRFARLVKPDGSYDEGVGYCNYATEYLIFLMEVIRRKTGKKLFDAANFVGVMQFDLAMFMPHTLAPAGSVNFGDAGTSLKSHVGFWIARQSRDGFSQYIALNYPQEHSIFSLIWYDPTVKPEPPIRSCHLIRLDLDWIIARTGYEPDDLVAAMRSGGPSNHEHADRNSVILKFAGEILLADAKRPTYNHHDPGWFLRTSPAHNTVLINGQGHQYHDGSEGTNESKAAASIVRHGERNGYVFWASDATPAYALVDENVKSVTRTVLVLHQIPALIVLDKLRMKDSPATFTARWHVENSDKAGTCEVDGKSFSNFRPGGFFYAVCAGSPGISVTAGRHPLPESVGIFPYVDITTLGSAMESLLITAGCPLFNAETRPEIEISARGSDWLIQIKKNAKCASLRILPEGALPEFEMLHLD
ncbi:heparinase II/III family protein [candidate division KSB1 bacterium]|nr:heparinase II/III family protein [candidate division KSB1 bacterium]